MFLGYIRKYQFVWLSINNVTDMNKIFYECYSLTEIDFLSFNINNITNMIALFSDSFNLT